MSEKQSLVLWIGLILVTFNLVRKWKEIAGVIFSGAQAPPAGGGNTSGDGGGNSIQVPIDPFLPTGPKITVPLPKL